jgi:PRC-barrel domain
MHKFIMATLAGAALIAVPAIAQHAGHGPASGPPTTSSGQAPGSTSMGNQGHNSTTSMQPSTTQPTDTTTTATTTRDQARSKSQGPNNASPTGISHANENSVLAGGSVAADTLPGLTTGLNVQSSSGTSLGTVSQVITGSNGSVRMIVVTTSDGQTIRLPANSLSISGDVVTTTSTTTP